MSMPGNGIFVVRGEISILITAMRRGAAARWSSHSHQDDDDNLMKNLQELKDVLNKIDDLRLIQPLVYLEPFLEIIRSGDTTGPITSLALSAVGKFLSYGLMDPTLSSIPKTVHQIADAVTHARFVGTDQTSDGVVLMRILQVLRTLTLAPEGITLTNESLCEIMLSCFRICFETRLNELLRRTAEYYLKDMVHLIFMRLPQFSEDSRNVKQLIKMRPGVIEQTTRTTNKRRRSFRIKKDEQQQQQQQNLIETPDLKQSQHLATTPITPSSNIVDMQGTISRNSSNIENNNSEINITPDCQQDNQKIDDNDDGSKENLISTTPPPPPPLQQEQPQSNDDDDVVDDNNEDQEYVNQRGIRFAQKIPQEETILIPYGLACVRELLRFLISLCNPNDKQNTDIMIHLGLTLLTVAFEIGADNIGKHATLLMLVKDGLCRNLFSLLNSERVSVFAADLQLCFLIFESLRVHLKYQLEFYLTKLIEIIVSDTGKITYEHKEIALDNILQLWRIPGFITELYINYDCNMYCTNLYEDLTKLLAKNAFSASTTSGIYHTHMLSLNALLTVIDNIENNCNLSNKKETNRMIITRRIDVIDENNETIESIENFIETNQQQQQRFKLIDDIPKKDKLMACKHIKKWLPMGTEHFNHKPKKGIQFFQEHGILKPELDPYEIAIFLKENTNLDKKMIGEFISNRSNLHILDAFVKTFDFTNMRIDQALRYYLETFRLPGEAPTISLLLEHFAEHWHKSNGEPFADVDSAFTLAYAIIMLNVDQHNQNAKKQTTPMSLNGFKKNLKGVNGGGDFDEEMLDEIYHAIKNEEIVMPAEQTGIVRENYLWKVLLRKGESRDGQYYRIINNEYDPELFSLIFGPIIAALSFIFDRSDDQLIYEKAIDGFKKCAYISSSFNMIQNIDTILLTLCKFTTFHHNNTTTTHRNLNNIINFGNNRKAQLSLKTLTEFYHLYGDNIRDGWKYLFNLLLSLYCNNLLTKTFVEVEDFIQQNGKIILNYEEPENLQKQDISLFSSLYSYMLSNDNLTKIPTVEEQQSIDLAKQIITECNLEQIITDSKFLHDDSLKELINALIELSRGPDLQEQHINLNYNYNENLVVFFLELLVKIVIQNRDRVMVIWQTVRDHLYTLVMNSSLFDYQFLLERAVIDLLRIAIRLMRNEEMSPIVLQSLRMLLLLKSTTISRISRQISYGLYELLKTSAQNIHTQTDWSIIFTLLECVGAGAQPPKPIIANNTNENHQDDDHGYTSDNELIKNNNNNNNVSPSNGGSPSGWILVGNNENDIQPVVGRTVPPNQYNLLLERNLSTHDPYSLMKCCESLAFLVRDVAHITPYNFDDCVHCIRTFVEASLNGNKKHQRYRKLNHKKSIRKSPPTSSPDDSDNDDGGGDDDLPNGYHQIAIQLLDLMHTLHTRTAQIFKWWAEEGGTVIETQNISLWTQGWCPLLQGIARLCCDQRRDIRMSAITYLQRALLVHDLQTLNGIEWEQCFHRVLFPLLNHLLLPIEHNDCVAMEETRMRAATLLSKVFLHHLTPLLSLPTFPNLWLIILDFIDKYMHADHSDLLYEAIPESLKNMLLVMDSAGVFNNNNNNSNNTKGPLWYSTWDRINKFLPNMKDELFKEIEQIDEQQQQQQQSNKNDVIKQHNIENATKSSIILQPLATNQPVSSHLFAHLGQMVSTPIPPCTSTDTVFQSNLQPYLYTQNENTFPVLYNSPIISTTTTTTTVSTITTTSESTNVPPSSQQQQQQPVPLYTEYIENPYNIKETDVNLDVNDNNDDSITQDDDNNIDNRNYFQSSTYFQIDTNNIPTGCEILYGKQQTTKNDDHDDKNSVIPQTIQTNDCTDV